MDHTTGSDGPVAPTRDPVPAHDTPRPSGPTAAREMARPGKSAAGDTVRSARTTGTGGATDSSPPSDGPAAAPRVATPGGATGGDTPPSGSGGAPGLAALGLAPGDRVRWRDRKSTRWREGRVVARERDGSVGVRDARGASRALRLERLEVRDRGPRGGVVWEPLPDRAARTEQLGLWGAEPGQQQPPPSR